MASDKTVQLLFQRIAALAVVNLSFACGSAQAVEHGTPFLEGTVSQRGVNAPAVALVEDGKAVAEVVLPADALKVERFAAEELVKFVKRATGAALPVVRERKPGKAAVLVGRASGLSGFAPNEARVAVRDGALLLAGGDGDGDSKKWTTPAGTLFAVYDFLEREAGVRWLWPDENVGTSVPRRRTLAAAAGTDRTWRPELVNAWARNFEARFGRRLCRARKMQPRFPEGVNGHAFIHWWKKYGKTHPEFFEMNANGTRVPGSMCVANPAFHEEIVRLWREARAREPGVKFDINACENDTKGKCRCPLCKAWNAPEADPKDASERYAHFYKALYDLAKADDPDVKIHAYAYSNYRNPPRLFKLPRNVHMEYVPSPKFPYTPETKKVIFDRIHAWVASGATLNYRPNVLDGYAMPEDYSVDYYAEFQEMRKAHMDYIDVDGPNVSYSTQGPLIYAMGRLMVDPAARIDDLRDEYFGAFGPAKSAVRDYWDYWDRYTRDNAEMFHEVPKKHNPIRHGMFFGFHYAFYAHHLFPPEVLAKGAALIGKALEAAKDSPDDLKRVEFLAAGLEHARLCAAACAVFADKKSSVEKRLAALNAVRDFRRERLPKYASNVAAWTRNGYNEQLAWTFDAFDPDRMIDLPLEWKFRLDPKDAGEGLGYAKADFDDSGWKTVLTDRHLEYQGVEPGYENVWYRHVVDIPEKFRGRRTIVRFGAIDESCRFWANGRYVGRFDFNPAVVPRSWEKPLEFDVTPFVGDDGRLAIALKVVNRIGRGGLVKPSRVLFFDTDEMKVAIDADHPMNEMSFKTFGSRIERRGKDFAFIGGDKASHGRIHLGMLKAPAGKTLHMAFRYRTKGKGRVRFFVSQKEVGKKVLASEEVFLPPSEDWTERTVEANIVEDVHRVDLAVRNELRAGSEMEVSSVVFELKPRTFAGEKTEGPQREG